MFAIRKTLTNTTLHSVESVLNEVDEDTFFSLLSSLCKPVLSRGRKLLPAVAKTGALAASAYFVYRKARTLLERRKKKLKWQQKVNLSLVSAQLYACYGDRGEVRYVDKRTLWEKKLQKIGILEDEFMAKRILKAAEKTTREDPFVTSNLDESDTWYVLSAMLNELSCAGGLRHCSAMQEKQKRFAEGNSDDHRNWYVIALVNPKWAKDELGYAKKMSSSKNLEMRKLGDLPDQKVTKLRLMVIWEEEMFSMVCGVIQPAPSGLKNVRQKRRYKMMKHVARRYKLYLCREIFRRAMEKQDSERERKRGRASLLQTESFSDGTHDPREFFTKAVTWKGTKAVTWQPFQKAATFLKRTLTADGDASGPCLTKDTRTPSSVKEDETLDEESETTRDTSKCPNGHFLMEAEAPLDGYECDICGSDRPGGELNHCCRPCDYDVCPKCFEAAIEDSSFAATADDDVRVPEANRYLTEQEFIDVAKEFMDLPPSVATLIFREHDSNGDKKLSIKEVVTNEKGSDRRVFADIHLLRVHLPLGNTWRDAPSSPTPRNSFINVRHMDSKRFDNHRTLCRASTMIRQRSSDNTGDDTGDDTG